MCKADGKLFALLAASCFSSFSFGQAIAQGELHCNDVRNESLGRAEQHIYTFHAEAGDVVGLVLYRVPSYEGGFGPVATIYGPPAIGDTPLEGQAGRSGTWFIEIPETGTFSLRVNDDDMFQIGSYVLGIHWLYPSSHQCAVTPLLCREKINRSLDRRADEHWYSLSASAGDKITFTLYRTPSYEGGFGPVMDLLKSTSAEAVFSSLSGVVDFVMPVTGEYRLRVRDDDQYQVGSYVLSIQRLEPFCDCNSNGVADDADIASGTSRDDDGNLAPDECQNGAWYHFEDAGPGCVKLMVQARVPITGGEIALRYNSAKATVTGVTKGAAISGFADSRLDSQFDLTTPNCPNDPAVSRGLRASWINSQGGSKLLGIGTHEVLKICFNVAAGSDSPLKFISGCIGSPQALNMNAVTNQVGDTLPATTVDYGVSAPDGIFKRGDANDDGRFDISDPITILLCKFVDPRMCHTCEDASDADDNGTVELTDAVYLLMWRFQNGTPPKAPFPACGTDPTAADTLPPCDFGSCN